MVVDHQVLTVLLRDLAVAEVDAGDRAEALLDDRGLPEGRLDIVDRDAAILAAHGAAFIVRREFDHSDCLAVGAVLGLGHWRPLVALNYEEVAVQHPDRDLLAVVGERDDVGAAFKLCVPDLPLGRDVPDAKHAILTDRQELLLVGMGGQATDLLVVV